MNKFDYDFYINNIRLLEIKLERIKLEKEYLELIKPSFFDVKKRKKWKARKKQLLERETNESQALLLAYTKLEKIF